MKFEKPLEKETRKPKAYLMEYADGPELCLCIVNSDGTFLWMYENFANVINTVEPNAYECLKVFYEGDTITLAF